MENSGWGPGRSDLLTKVWGGSLGTLTSDRAEKRKEGGAEVEREREKGRNETDK